MAEITQTTNPGGQVTVQSSDLLAAVLAASADVIIVIDRHGVISYANQATERVLGHLPSEWIGTSVLELIHPEDVSMVLGELDDRITTPGSSPSGVTLRVADSRGRWLTVEATGVNQIEHDEASGMVVVIRDITDRLEAEQHLDSARRQLDYVSNHDPLTRLPNRDRLEAHIDGLARRSFGDAGADVLAELMMVKVADVDTLRIRYGVDEAECILRSLGDAVRSEAHGAFVASNSVGEFVVVRPANPAADDDLAHRLLGLADIALSSRRGRADVRLSVGVTSLRYDMTSGEVLDRLGRAASWGSARRSAFPVIFDERFDDLVGEKSRIGLDVERGLAAGEFELHYQPIRCLRTGRIDGFEGLIRWNHPTEGLLPAGRFLPAVEGTAVMMDIGELVVAEACETLARWQRRLGRRSPSLAINVSARQLRQGSFADSVEQALAAAGADPSGLSVELTETHALEGEPRAIDELALLRQLGVRIALDDFGTGYSTLHHLQKIRADILKIDRSFIENLGVDEGATAIVRAAIDLAQAFGATTVAEGVTTEQQLQMLRSMGCKQIQGFLVAPALAPACADSLLDVEYVDGPARELEELWRRLQSVRLSARPARTGAHTRTVHRTIVESEGMAEVIPLVPRQAEELPSGLPLRSPGSLLPVVAQSPSGFTQLA